ncbi:MAG TPA: hypothetical protein VKS98_08135 [Chthoniobacterales bacterium]|nr:hypothetical protein [Chthoniobacterales bacterium]
MLPIFSVFATAQVRARRTVATITVAQGSSIVLTRTIRTFISTRTLPKVSMRTATWRALLVPWASIPGPAFSAIFAVVSGVAFGGRRFAHPRRQHFQID